jgi:hypothetical protein
VPGHLQQKLDLKTLLNHVIDGKKLSDEYIAEVIDTINALRKDQHE